MDNLTHDLEELLLTKSLTDAERDSVEHALDEGYASLSDDEKSSIRRALNRKAAQVRMSPLQRYRAHRRDIALATRHHTHRRPAAPAVRDFVPCSHGEGAHI